ncbi:MAG: hypothetical protein ACE145_20105 [Terriglobia bacterium]
MGILDAAINATLTRLDETRFSARLWDRDAALWKSEPEHQRIIHKSLGWLTVPQSMLEKLDEVLALVEEVRVAGYKHAVVLGMGGSSLCPDVCRATFGTTPGYLRLHVLDSTVPASVARIAKDANPGETLYLVSSKSGGTVETLSFYKYFRQLVEEKKGDKAGENFVAITDPGTSLERLAKERGFRRVFPGQPDIGGRYSALSNFGMVPAALAGVDVRALLTRASEMAQACGPSVLTRENPGVSLGVVLGEAALAGRNKLTFIMSPSIYTFADWVEQLIAESVGKEGRGIVPIVREHLETPESYGNDRLFVHMKLASESNRKIEGMLRRLELAGHMVVRIVLQGIHDLGGEFFRWEVATATAGALLDIDPFDQPNVQESKDNTNRLLAQFAARGSFEESAHLAESEGVKFFCDAAQPRGASGTEGMDPSRTMEDCLAAFLSKAQTGDYVAILAYLDPSSGHRAALQAIRMSLRNGLRLATTLGFGPRYLHSTGQLHKGGAANGVFIIITGDDRSDLPVPGQPYTFSILKQAQALGDLESLRSRNLRVVRFHVGRGVQAGLDHLLVVVKGALKRLADERGRDET